MFPEWNGGPFIVRREPAISASGGTFETCRDVRYTAAIGG
jgi:hypothetical protein